MQPVLPECIQKCECIRVFAINEWCPCVCVCNYAYVYVSAVRYNVRLYWFHKPVWELLVLYIYEMNLRLFSSIELLHNVHIGPITTWMLWVRRMIMVPRLRLFFGLWLYFSKQFDFLFCIYQKYSIDLHVWCWPCFFCTIRTEFSNKTSTSITLNESKRVREIDTYTQTEREKASCYIPCGLTILNEKLANKSIPVKLSEWFEMLFSSSLQRLSSV